MCIRKVCKLHVHQTGQTQGLKETLNIKAPIHGATLLLETVAGNNVAWCMIQCCAVARCQQLLPENRPLPILQQQLPQTSKGRLYVTLPLHAHVVETVPPPLSRKKWTLLPRNSSGDSAAAASSETEERSSFRWTDQRIDELITLFEDRPCLYNVKSKNYFNRDLRRKALAEIGTALGTSGKPNLTRLYILATHS